MLLMKQILNNLLHLKIRVHIPTMGHILFVVCILGDCQSHKIFEDGSFCK